MPTSLRESGNLANLGVRDNHHSSFHAASRSSWFVPLVGIGICIFSMILASVQGSKIPQVGEFGVGLSLICYRLWPPAARYRVMVLGGEVVVFVICLVVRMLALALKANIWKTWFGDRSVGGLVLDSLGIVVLTLTTFDKIPVLFHSPSTLRFWRVPASFRLSCYVITFSLCSMFNPSIFVFPLFLVLVVTLSQLSSGRTVADCLVSHIWFPVILLVYCMVYALTGLVLCLPVIGDAVKTVSWLPGTLGIPTVGESSTGESHNYSCVLPCAVILFVQFTLLPWWIDVGLIYRNTAQPRRMMRTSTRGSGPLGFSRAGSANPSVLSISPPIHRGPSSIAGVSIEESDTEEGKQEREKLNRKKDFFKKILGASKYFFGFIVFPLTLIVVALVLPSTLSTAVLVAGLGLIVFPITSQMVTANLLIYLISFSFAIFVASLLWPSSGPQNPSVAIGLGIIPRNGVTDVWGRFLMLLATIGLAIFTMAVNRFCEKELVKASTRPVTIDEIHDEPLPPVDEDAESVDIENEEPLYPIWIQVVASTLRAPETGLVLLCCVIFSVSYLSNQTSAISIVYLLIFLPSLWFSEGPIRGAFAVILTAIATTFACAVVLWVSWATFSPNWIYDLGFPDPNVDTCFLTALPHVLVVGIGGLFLRLESVDIRDSRKVLSELVNAHPMVYVRLSLLVPMILSLALFASQPFDYFSALVIVCFVVQMALLQESNASTVYLAIIQINVVQSAVLIATLVWVLFSMIPIINQWVIDGLANCVYLKASELAVEPDCRYLGKLCLVAALLVPCSLMLRNRKFIESAANTPSDNWNDWVTTSPVLSKIVIVLSSQLPRLLLMVIFIASIYQTTLLNFAAQFLVCLFLVVGRGWTRIGAVFSVVSMCLLLLQYMTSFAVVSSSTNASLLDYLGMYWTSGSVARNMAIFMACIIQRNVKNFTEIHFGKRHGIAFPRLNKYSGILVGIVLIFAAVGRGNFYSILYAIVGIGLIVHQSRGNRQIPTWVLRLVSVAIWICLTVQLLLRLWFPTTQCSSCPARPDLSFMCPPGLSANEAVTCLDDWQKFFNVPTSIHGSTALIDNSQVRIAVGLSLGLSEFYTIPTIKVYGLIWDFLALWLICIVVQNQFILRQPLDDRPISHDSGVTSLTNRSKRRRFANEVNRFVVRFWIGLVEILAILSCFSFRNTVDLFNAFYVAYVLLLAWVQEKDLSVRRQVVVFGSIVSALFVFVSILYQVPVFPCKYWYASCQTSPLSPPLQLGAYAVPTPMCVDMQERLSGCENFGAFTINQIIIQVIGVLKSSPYFFASPFPMTVGPPVLLLGALLVQLALYDHSQTYERIDRLYYVKESHLRSVRARRLVVEFNARLLDNNRKVKSALEASRRKLHRVQQSADALLSIFYSRLAGVASGEIVRTQTDHLSTETETVCSRGYSEEEASMALELAKGLPEGTALLILESATEYAKGTKQESDVMVDCKQLLDTYDPPESNRRSKFRAVLSAIGWLYEKLKSIATGWIDDVAFLSDNHAAGPLPQHRRANGLFVLTVKAIYSNSQFFVCFFIILAFVDSNSVFDLIRVMLLLLVLPSWPFASRGLWIALLIYSFIGILIKTIYQMPAFCSVGVESSGAFLASLWRFTDSDAFAGDYRLPCPQATIVGWDIIVGMSKMMGSSALTGVRTTSFEAVIWADSLIIASLFMYRSLLYKCGVWEHLIVARLDRDGGAILVRRQRVETERIRIEVTEDPVARDDDEADDEEIAAGGALEEEAFGEDFGEPESPIGSFIDIDFQPLDRDEPHGLSKYAVQRHMSCEDVFDRLTIATSDGVISAHQVVLNLLHIYKTIRWDAQYEYANHDCVRLSRVDRDEFNQSAARGIAGLGIFSKMYVKANPFFAIKVGKDFYTYLFTIGLMMFFHVIVFYSRMTNSDGGDFVASLRRSQFSAGLALMMFFHFVLIVFDRAYYIASFRRSHEGGQFTAFRTHRFLDPSNQQVAWYFIRVTLLIVLVVILHIVIMNMLLTVQSTSPVITKGDAYTPLIKNSALSVYYLEFMVYIVVSVLQLREGLPRIMKESLRPEKSYHVITDKIQEIRFIIYRAIPFLDELRILIDWTVSKTCLDLLQYFKLEDAHTYMWTTKRDMETRKRFWPAEPIQKLEKGFMGCGLLLLLMLVIIGPVLVFSTLISPGTIAPISQSALRVTLVAQTCPGCQSWSARAPISTSKLALYSSLPEAIETLSFTDAQKYIPQGNVNVDSSTTVQALTYSKGSDATLQASAERLAAFKAAVASAVMLDIETTLMFKRESGDGGYVGAETIVRMPACACQVGFSELCSGCQSSSTASASVQFAAMRQATLSLLDDTATDVVYLPSKTVSVVQVDASGSVQIPQFTNTSSVLAVLENQGFVAGWTSSCNQLDYVGVCPGATELEIVTSGKDPQFVFIMSPVNSSDSAGGALLSIGIATVYITIVYAIGRFLRIVFDKESLRVIYLEIPRPDDFLDLATGASIARHYKDLPMEFRLYNCLIKVMRSPETLIALGGADLTGYGTGRHDDPPHPDLLSEDDRERLRRRRVKSRQKSLRQ